MSVSRAVEVALTIPDNEARTALATLQRLGVNLGGLERTDVYRFDLEPAREADLVAALRGLEAVFNPNKHALRVRADARPDPSEVWISEIESGPAGVHPEGVRIAGRPLPGAERLERFTVWRLFDRSGAPAQPEVVALATETLLCNPAFQKATVRT